MTDAGLPEAPVFIVCNARSGSTLLRYLLDVHPAIACPPETRTVAVARSLMGFSNDLTGNPTLERLIRKRGRPEPTAQSVSTAREAITGIVAEHLATKGKTVWCDKSLDTVHSLELIARVFPEARFICLHRHAMDVVASLLESCRWGFGYFDIQPYVARQYNNLPMAMAEYWVHRTTIMTALEQSRASTYSLCYEHLVSDPAATLTGLLDFLGVESGADTVARMTDEAFHGSHDLGAADWKIPLTSSVEQRSVERGRAVPLDLIREPLRGRMNALLATLHYPQVTEGWNTSSALSDDVDRSLLAAEAPDRWADDLVLGLLARRLATHSGGPAPQPLRLVATYGCGAAISWRIDPERRTISRASEHPEAHESVTVTMRVEVLRSLATQGLASQSAFRLDMMAVEGLADDAGRLVLERFMSSLLTP